MGEILQGTVSGLELAAENETVFEVLEAPEKITDWSPVSWYVDEDGPGLHLVGDPLRDRVEQVTAGCSGSEKAVRSTRS